MDLRDRNVQRPAATPAVNPPAAPIAGPPRDSGNSSRKDRHGPKGKLWRSLVVAGVVAVAVIIGAVAVVTASSNNAQAENKYVFSDKLQAVFLNNGQVYFGHIGTLSPQYFRITDVYYLKTGNSSASGSSTSAADQTISLVKLGCELHEPYDQIVINRDQVTFWENLQDNGQVAKAVATFQKQNPSGQKCADQSSSASNNGGAATQNTTTPTTTSTGTGTGSSSTTNTSTPTTTTAR